MAYEVPPLPYDFAALEPHIDAKTMEIHHDKHHQAYVDKVNAALEGTDFDGKPIEEVLKNLDALPSDKQKAVRNNGGGHYNHSLFWEWMSPDGGGEPDGDLAEAINTRVRLLLRLPGEVQGDRRQPVRLRLGLADPRRLRPRGRRHAQPGQPDLRGQDAAAGRRRLGARLLPQVPEQAPRLPRRLVEHRQLGEGRRGLLGGLLIDQREFYEAGYTQPDAAEALRLGRWRELGARSKAAHVRALCARTKLRPRTIVEIGCGDGALLAALRGLAPVFDGFELSAPAAELARTAAARRPPDRGLRRRRGARRGRRLRPRDPLPRARARPRAGAAARRGRARRARGDRRGAARGQPLRRPAGQARGGRAHRPPALLLARRRPRARWPTRGSSCRPSSTDPLPRAHHAFFASGAPARAAATAKWAVRAAAHRVAPALFTVHYAVLARRP